MNDREYMQRALALAKNGWGWTSPNPMVGAVIVKDGEIIGEGWHAKYGQLHAERAALAACGLTNEHITSKMMVLSGGEAAKVRLCKIMQKPVNLLVLDEPTNHLDVDAKAELKRALKEYKGAILLVSHEPDFYEDWVDSVWNIEGWTTKII